MILALVLAIATTPAMSSTDAKLFSIHKESCQIYEIVKHQREILHKYSEISHYSDEDLLRIKFAKSTVRSEQKRMNVLSQRYVNLSGKSLTWNDCQ